MAIEWFTQASYAMRAAKAGYDHRHAIQKYWARAKAYADLGKTQILITGAPSAGKTLLSGQMHGKARTLYYEKPDASLGVETDAIQLGQWTKLVRVLPGQTNLRTQGEIDAFASNDSLEGLIHVVDWGYSLPRDPSVQISLVKRDGIQTIKQLREYNLEIELDALKSEIGNIRKSFHSVGRPKWLIIAVNKVDLFQEDLPDALLYYHKEGAGPFSSALRSLEKDLGSTNFHIYTMQTCADEENFEYNKSAVASNLDRGAKDMMLRNFVNAVSYIADSHL